jgi:hypothetical protein
MINPIKKQKYIYDNYETDVPMTLEEYKQFSGESSTSNINHLIYLREMAKSRARSMYCDSDVQIDVWKSFVKGIKYFIQLIVCLILFAIGLSVPAAAIKYLFKG